MTLKLLTVRPSCCLELLLLLLLVCAWLPVHTQQQPPRHKHHRHANAAADIPQSHTLIQLTCLHAARPTLALAAANRDS